MTPWCDHSWTEANRLRESVEDNVVDVVYRCEDCDSRRIVSQEHPQQRLVPDGGKIESREAVMRSDQDPRCPECADDELPCADCFLGGGGSA